MHHNLVTLIAYTDVAYLRLVVSRNMDEKFYLI